MSKIDEVMKAWQEDHQKVSWQDLQTLKAENEALRAQIGQGEPVGTAISYYTEDGHTKWTFQPTKLGWEMPQDSRANERGARSCFDVYAHSAPQANKTHVLVPLRMTRAMQDVVSGEDWSWADLLAAAEAVTEDEFAAAEQTEPIVPQVSVVQQKPLTDEQDRALCEAYCNAASDEYFKARPQLDSDVNRRIFYAGHRKAWIEWQAAHNIGEKK